MNPPSSVAAMPLPRRTRFGSFMNKLKILLLIVVTIFPFR